MANEYTIKIQNDSGAPQQYALFNAKPLVHGVADSQIWTNVFAVGNTPSTAHAEFNIFKQYYAIVATSNGSLKAGLIVSVSKEMPVTLGSTTDDGKQNPGSTLALEVKDHAPQFSSTVPAKGGFVNAFEIATGTDFTVAEAEAGNFMIGLGGSSNGGTGPAAIFSPQPNSSYQIQPVNTYYLTFGDYTKGALMDVQKTGETTLELDFTKLKSTVNIVHSANGKLNIQV